MLLWGLAPTVSDWSVVYSPPPDILYFFGSRFGKVVSTRSNHLIYQRQLGHVFVRRQNSQTNTFRGNNGLFLNHRQVNPDPNSLFPPPLDLCPALVPGCSQFPACSVGGDWIVQSLFSHAVWVEHFWAEPASPLYPACISLVWFCFGWWISAAAC